MYSILVISILLKFILDFRDIPASIRLGRERDSSVKTTDYSVKTTDTIPYALFNLRDIAS